MARSTAPYPHIRCASGRKIAAARMRVSVMRAEATEAGCGDTAAGVMRSETTEKVVLGEYLDILSRLKRAPGGSTAVRERASGRRRLGASGRDHDHDSSDAGPAAP